MTDSESAKHLLVSLGQRWSRKERPKKPTPWSPCGRPTKVEDVGPRNLKRQFIVSRADARTERKGHHWSSRYYTHLLLSLELWISERFFLFRKVNLVVVHSFFLSFRSIAEFISPLQTTSFSISTGDWASSSSSASTSFLSFHKESISFSINVLD